MGAILAFIYFAVAMSLLCRKMGFPSYLGLLTVTPGFGWLLWIGLIWYMAFARWPRWIDHWTD